MRWRHRLWVASSGAVRFWALPWLALRRLVWRLRFGWLIPQWVALRVRTRARWQSLPAWGRVLVRWVLGWAVPALVGLGLLRLAAWLLSLFSRPGS